MLAKRRIEAFVPSRNPKKARKFYEKVLGLKVTDLNEYALTLDANGITVRVTDVSSVPGFKPAPFTILGWEVPDIEKAVRGLKRRGVKFQRYPGMDQDALGIWASPGGSQVAWFKDTDGNVLSLSQQ